MKFLYWMALPVWLIGVGFLIRVGWSLAGHWLYVIGVRDSAVTIENRFASGTSCIVDGKRFSS